MALVSRYEFPQPECASCPIRDRTLVERASEQELEQIALLRSDVRYLLPGAALYSDGEECSELYTVFSGWAYTYKLLGDGRRQIYEFLLQGDFVGLSEYASGLMDHSAEAITDLSVCVFPRKELAALIRTEPLLASRLVWLASHEEALLHRRMTGLGRRNALERIGHLLLELYTGLEQRRQVSNGRCRMPLTQEVLADALGLSVPHISRTLRQIREAGLATFHNGYLQIHNFDRLVDLCGYESRYFAPRPVI